MRQLSPEGQAAVNAIAQRTGFSPDAVTSMLYSVIAGNGSMAQFNHPEFGGSGQWMRGGMTMVSDMFNNAMKGRVDGLCNELSSLIASQPGLTVSGSFQSQSQSGSPSGQWQSSGGMGMGMGMGGGQSSLFVPDPSGSSNWWPSDLGAPSSVGSQNNVRYAYFPGTRRLAINLNGQVTVYDTLDHQIGGFSQQQSGSGSITFSSQYGMVNLSSLPLVSGAGQGQHGAPSSGNGQQSQPPADQHSNQNPVGQNPVGQNPVGQNPVGQQPISQQASGQFHPQMGQTSGPVAMSQNEVMSTIEKLADLHAKGILSDQEYSTKKAELLSRL